MAVPSELASADVDRAVRTLTARYCDAVARYDVEQFATLWADDADWIVPGARTTSGRERIARLFAKLRGDYDLCTQELMSGWVTPGVDGSGTARARWQIRELQWKGERVSCVIGIYSDRLRVDDTTWVFASRQFDVLYRGPVDLTAPVHAPPELPSL